MDVIFWGRKASPLAQTSFTEAQGYVIATFDQKNINIFFSWFFYFWSSKDIFSAVFFPMFVHQNPGSGFTLMVNPDSEVVFLEEEKIDFSIYQVPYKML